MNEPVKCPECHEGWVRERVNKKSGATFYGCSKYPVCRWSSNKLPELVAADPDDDVGVEDEDMLLDICKKLDELTAKVDLLMSAQQFKVGGRA